MDLFSISYKSSSWHPLRSVFLSCRKIVLCSKCRGTFFHGLYCKMGVIRTTFRKLKYRMPTNLLESFALCLKWLMDLEIKNIFTDIVRRPCQRVSLFIWFKILCQTIIWYFYITVSFKQNILWFQVSVNVTQIMQVS